MPQDVKLRRRLARVEYADGATETYNIGKPVYEYQVKQLGVDPVDQPTDSVFFTLWLSAGKPGAPSGALTEENARPALEAWLETIEAYEFTDSDADPPTKKRAPSRS